MNYLTSISEFIADNTTLITEKITRVTSRKTVPIGGGGDIYAMVVSVVIN